MSARSALPSLSFPNTGIRIDYAIVDTGYFSERNVKELYRSRVHFVTRPAPNRKLYKETLKSELSDIHSSKYAVRYGSRFVYMKKKKADVYGNPGYGYIGMDMDSRSQQFKRATFSAMEDKMPVECRSRE